MNQPPSPHVTTETSACSNDRPQHLTTAIWLQGMSLKLVPLLHKSNLKKLHEWMEWWEVDFLETMHRNWLKLLRHVSITPIWFPIKWFFKWMHGFQVRAKTNYVLGIFALRHSAVLLHGTKNELGLWCRYGDDGGGVWRLQVDFWTLAEAIMFSKPPFLKSISSFL